MRAVSNCSHFLSILNFELCIVLLPLLFQSRKREYVPRNTHCKQEHKHLRPPPLINHCKYTVTNREPHQRNRDYLHTQRNGTIFAKIAYIFTQHSVMNKPIIEFWRSLNPHRSRKKQKWRSGQHRKKNTQNA